MTNMFLQPVINIPIPETLMQRFVNTAESTADPATSMLQNMINNPTAADVLFLVGPNRTPIYAHSMILTNSSAVFYDMFVTDGITADGYDPIVLEDYTAEEFIEFLWFVYCKQCIIDEDNAYYMCRKAVRFAVTELYPHILKWMVDRSPEPRPLLDYFFAKQAALPAELSDAFVKIFLDNPLEFTTCRNLDTSDTFHSSYRNLLNAIEDWIVHEMAAEKQDEDMESEAETSELDPDRGVHREDPFFSGNLVVQRPCSVNGITLIIGTTRKRLGATELDAVIRIGGRRDYILYEKVSIPVKDQMYEYSIAFQNIPLEMGEQLEMYVALEGPNRALNWNLRNGFSCFIGDENLQLSEYYMGELISPLSGFLYDFEESCAQQYDSY